MKEGLEGESVHDVFEFCDVRSERRGALLLGVRFVRSTYVCQRHFWARVSELRLT